MNLPCQHPMMMSPIGPRLFVSGNLDCLNKLVISISLSPSSKYGGLPVQISYRVEPRANRSARVDFRSAPGHLWLAVTTTDGSEPSNEEPLKSRSFARRLSSNEMLPHVRSA